MITGGVVNTLCGLGSSKIANTPFVSGIDYVAKVLFENFDGQIGTIFDYFYSVLDDLSGDSLGEMGSILCRPPTGLVHVLANLKEVIEDTMAPGNEKDIEYGAGLEARQFICGKFFYGVSSNVHVLSFCCVYRLTNQMLPFFHVPYLVSRCISRFETRHF